MEAENIVDKKELKGLPIWACILLFIVVFFVFMLLYSALIQGFLSLVLGVEARHPGIVALTSGSHATGLCEPCQVGNGAALSRTSRVP